jgi:hypothetical protein
VRNNATLRSSGDLPNGQIKNVDINVSRVDAHRYRTTVERGDGVMLSVPGYGFMRALPHDLAHLPVEATLGKAQGFWGSIAAGAIFPGMSVLGGRQKPHAGERASAVAKGNADALGEAECLVAAFETIITDDLDRQWLHAEAYLKERLSSRPRAHIPGHSEIDAVCAAWRGLQARWDRTAVDETIHLDWPVRTVRSSSRTKQKQR